MLKLTIKLLNFDFYLLIVYWIRLKLLLEIHCYVDHFITPFNVISRLLRLFKNPINILECSKGNPTNFSGTPRAQAGPGAMAPPRTLSRPGRRLTEAGQANAWHVHFI